MLDSLNLGEQIRYFMTGLLVFIAVYLVPEGHFWLHDEFLKLNQLLAGLTILGVGTVVFFVYRNLIYNLILFQIIDPFLLKRKRRLCCLLLSIPSSMLFYNFGLAGISLVFAGMSCILLIKSLSCLEGNVRDELKKILVWTDASNELLEQWWTVIKRSRLKTQFVSVDFNGSAIHLLYMTSIVSTVSIVVNREDCLVKLSVLAAVALLSLSAALALDIRNEYHELLLLRTVPEHEIRDLVRRTTQVKEEVLFTINSSVGTRHRGRGN